MGGKALRKRGFAAHPFFETRGFAMLKPLLKLKRAVMLLYSSVAATALFVLIVSAFVQVVGRYIFNSSPTWTEELARYAFVWFGCLGAAVALDQNLHASISIFMDMLPARLQHLLKVLLLALVLAISILLVVTGLQLTKATVATPSPAMRISMAWVNSAIIFCGLGMAVTTGYSILEALFGGKAAAPQGGEHA